LNIDVAELLQERQELLIFTIIWIGYLIGKIRIFGIELGASIGVLLVALAMGHWGFSLSPIVGTLGFVFFIYSVGYQAGPRFFATFKKDGKAYLQLSLVVVLTAVAMTFIVDAIFDLDTGYTAGIMAGALTSTPTLASAQDAVSSGIAKIPEGITADQVRDNIAVAYAIAYIFGLLGLSMVIQFLPKLMKIDLVAEAKRYVEENGGSQDSGAPTMPQVRYYSVTANETAGKTLTDLLFLQSTKCTIVKLVRNGEELEVGPATRLELGDHLAVMGRRRDQIGVKDLIGSESNPEEMATCQVVLKTIAVGAPAAGRTIRDAGITNECGCMVVKATRGGVDLPVSPDLVLQRGDVIRVGGIEEGIAKLGDTVGRVEAPVHQTDLLVFALGICVGIVIGKSSLNLGVPIGVGLAGGLLSSGLVVGWMRTSHPLVGNVPQAARYILMELGILFFMAGVGSSAGGGLIEGLKSAGLPIFISGVFITLVPTLVALWYGHKIMKMNGAILFGAVAGGLTSTPSLSVVTRAADSNVPALGYAGVYAFAIIMLTIAGQVMMMMG
jgi:putative transport protein